MNILGNNQAKMNNVIFANRNRAYGAYAIRSEYSESLRKSLFIVGGFVLLLFSFVYGYNKLNGTVVEENAIVIDDLKPEIFKSTVVDLTPLEEKPIQQTAAASAAPNTGLGTVITDG